MRAREIPVGDDGGRGSIAQPRRVACRDGASLLENGHEFCQRIYRTIAANRFIGIYHQRTLFLLYFNGADLVLEAASGSGGCGAPVGLQPELVLLRAGDAAL